MNCNVVHAIGSIMTAHAFLEFVMPVLAWVDDIAMPVSCIEAALWMRPWRKSC